MKLANALSQRSELQTRIRQLEVRLNNNAQVQEGEQPAEDPMELLKELEADGLVHREQFNEIPPHVEYSLTERGRDLLPVFCAMANWGLKYIP